MTSKPDRLEIWLGNEIVTGLHSSFVPRDGDLINILKVTYRVIGVSFSVDHADDMWERQMRCNVIVERHVE